MPAIQGNRAVAHIQPVQCNTPSDAAAAALSVRERRRSFFFVADPPRIAKAPRPEKPKKQIYVPSLAEKFASALRENPILKASTVNGTIIAPDGVISAAYTIENIQVAMCLVSGCKKNEMLGDRRLKYIVEPRQIAMFLCKRFTGRSLPEIGRRFGGKDHTTVLHAIRKFEWMDDKLPADGSQITEIAERAWALFKEREAEKSAA